MEFIIVGFAATKLALSQHFDFHDQEKHFRDAELRIGIFTNFTRMTLPGKILTS
jgi:hypothetical protein